MNTAQLTLYTIAIFLYGYCAGFAIRAMFEIHMRNRK